jgi:hypothetical protein
VIEKEIPEIEKGCIFILISDRLREPDPEKFPHANFDLNANLIEKIPLRESDSENANMILKIPSRALTRI